MTLISCPDPAGSPRATSQQEKARLSGFLLALVIASLIYGLSHDANRFSSDVTHWIHGGESIGPCLWGTLSGQSVANDCNKLSKWPLWNHVVAWVFSGLVNDQLDLWFG